MKKNFVVGYILIRYTQSVRYTEMFERKVIISKHRLLLL